ncbi:MULTISPECIES: hypothetical protein [Deinococcus]|uniref:Uncharacterized protein n=1 Tax=Deinococcus rufus TaxID=2136097 RepID=A0ABV7ZDK5_9DEIO|nr:hypothetical protein [Deinococcus sp. AB2017081]WQE96895.1 hypothetical protein U2P90_08335 [Deinococcus sp. AB2017081]
MDNRSAATYLTLAGAASILGSIAIWAMQGGQEKDEKERAHGERFGIFVGLWAPTFFILANRFHTAAVDEEK